MTLILTGIQKGFPYYNNYLDPQSMYNDGLYGRYYGLRAIILHAFGVWVSLIS